MRAEQEERKDGVIKAELVLKPEEFAQALRDAYLEHTDQIVVPGYAPGLAPREEIEKIYGPQVLYDEALDLCIPAAYRQYVRETRFHPVGKPSLHEITRCGDGGVRFLVEVEVYPDVTLGCYKGIRTEVPRDDEEKFAADVLTKACRNMKTVLPDSMTEARLDAMEAREKAAAAQDPVCRLLTECVYLLQEAYHAADVHRPMSQVRAEAMDYMLQSVSADHQGMEMDCYLAGVKECVRRYHDLPADFDQKLREIQTKRACRKSSMSNDEILDEMFETRLGTMELSEKQWRDEHRDQARDAALFDVLFTAVADREGIRVGEPEVFQAMERIAKQCAADFDEVCRTVDRDALEAQLIRDRAREFILNHAVGNCHK
ncbi:MAG: trigger factor family protein [Clostridiales bacterium]|nr:trigger factor family protein [Clostridiales bacterium]